MKLTEGTGWATINRWGDVLSVGRTRAEVIAAAARMFDRSAYTAARELALKGKVFPSSSLDRIDRLAWRRVRSKYGFRAVKVRVVPVTDQDADMARPTRTKSDGRMAEDATNGENR